MFELITQSMLYLLETLKSLVGSYGWAIVVLTVLVRLVLWPVSKSQMKSMKMMQELQPKMKQLQERHKTDPQRLQAEMFKLYKEYKFNPLGGCLPMLVQLPLFIGLFWAISNPHFMTTGDPTFLNFIHLKRSGIISHSGPSNDGKMNISEDGGGGGLFGMGKDTMMAGEKMRIVLANGSVLENKVPNPSQVLKILPKEPMPGVPLKISTTYDKLQLEGYEGLVQSIELAVVNSGSKEMENITLKPAQPTSHTFRTTLETVPGKTVMNLDVLILVILFAVTMFISQKMMTAQNTATGNEQQQQMMKMLPIIFSVFLFIFPIPAGVLLYMDTNSLFQIFQTWVFQRGFDAGKSQEPPSQTVLDIKPDKA